MTEEYQLESATINGQFYIIADTPGFDDPKTNNVAIFRNIVTLLQLVGNSVEFAGILYVHAMGSTQSREQPMEEEPIDHTGTERVGWLNILVSVISGTKRAI